MSVAMLSAVKAFQTTPTAKSVLVALADYSDDSGRCWPSVAGLCDFTCLSERAVRNAVRELERIGVLVSDRASGRPNHYVIQAEKARTTPARRAGHPTVTPAPDAAVTPAPNAWVVDVTPARGAPTPAPDAPPPRHVVPEPRHVVPPNHQEPSEQPPRTTKAAPPVSLVPEFPDWMPMEEWKAFVEMRTKKRKPLTAFAVRLLVKALDQLRLAGDDPAEIVNASIVGGWDKFYPLKRDQGRNGSQPSRLTTPAAGTDYGRL